MLTHWASSINTALPQYSGRPEMMALAEVAAKQQAYRVPFCCFQSQKVQASAKLQSKKIPKAHSTMFLTRTDYLIRAGKEMSQKAFLRVLKSGTLHWSTSTKVQHKRNTALLMHEYINTYIKNYFNLFIDKRLNRLINDKSCKPSNMARQLSSIFTFKLSGLNWKMEGDHLSENTSLVSPTSTGDLPLLCQLAEP